VACRVLEAQGERVSFDAKSDAQTQLRECSEQRNRGENSQAGFGQDVGSGAEMKERDSSKLDEQRANLYENKGSVFHRPRRSRNVYENKGGWPQKAGMLLKRKGVCGRWGGQNEIAGRAPTYDLPPTTYHPPYSNA
jgi:hypothetical protein